MVRSALGDTGSVAWLARDGDAVVGHVLTRVVLDEAELWTIAVSASHRRTGLATAMHAAVVDAWRARGVFRAHLEVRDDNTGARTLYERLGWQHAGTRRAYYADGCDALLLTLVL